MGLRGTSTMHVCLCMYVHTCIYIFIYVCVSLHMGYVCVYLYVCVYACERYIYIARDSDRGERKGERERKFSKAM